MNMYEPRPERIEAQVLTAENGEDLARWTGGAYDPDEGYLRMPTLDGTEIVRVEDERTVIKDLSTGRFRSMSSMAFDKRYQRQGTSDSGLSEYMGMQSEEDLQAVHQRKRLDPPLAG